MKIAFMQIMPDGFEVKVDGQRYRSLGGVKASSRNGEHVVLNGWTAQCLDCGVPFEATTKPDAPFYPSRRCRDHSKPGVKAR